MQHDQLTLTGETGINRAFISELSVDYCFDLFIGHLVFKAAFIDFLVIWEHCNKL